MSSTASSQPNALPQPLILWIIWASIFSGIFFIQFLVGGGFPSGESETSFPMPMGLVALSLPLASLVIRWVVLPRFHDFNTLLPVMIVGMALAEAGCFMEMFLIAPEYPRTRMTVFLFSAAVMLQYAPVYATRSRVTPSNAAPGATPANFHGD